VLQATALGFGELATVEPILVLELPLTLILASRVFGQGMHWREWGSAVVMTASLGALLFLLAPSAGRNGHVHWYGWAFGISVNVAVVGVLVVFGRRKSARGSGGAYRAALLGIAAGSAFGLTAALMKGMTRTFSAGIVTLFTSWEIYAMVAAGLLGMFLVQSALNAGGLIAAQPGLTLADPVVSVLWGVLAFHENVRSGWYIAPEVAAVAVLGAAVITLARSPLLADAAEET
jgi:drug/metabolite transporter (DMT)-like permease